MSTLRKRTPIGTVAYMGGVPAVLEEFCWAFAQMVQYNAESFEDRDHYIHYDRERMSLHDAARNALCDRQRMLGDWILFLDTDHEFEPDLCARMVRTMTANNIRVLGAVYLYRMHPHLPVIFHHDEESNRRRHITDWSDDLSVLPIDSAGAGSLLIRRDVLDEVRFKCNCEPFTRDGPYGEDHSFFARLRKCSIQPYVATHIQSHHLQVRPLSLDNYQRPGLTGGAHRFEVEGFGAAIVPEVNQYEGEPAL